MLTQNPLTFAKNEQKGAARLISPLLTVVRTVPADLETPVSVYLKLAGSPEFGQGPTFLLESVTGGEKLARYSFIGVQPRRALVLRGRQLEVHTGAEKCTLALARAADPLECLRAELARYQAAPLPGLPRFSGGLVGYLSYEMMRYFEPSVALQPHPDLPDAIFLLTDTVVAFDHPYGRLLLIANLPLEANEDEMQGRARAEARLDALQACLAGPLPAQEISGRGAAPGELQANITRQQYTDAVRAAKEYILAGDIFQVVLSQRLSRRTAAAPFSIYRALRRLNPSPYMYFFDFGRLAGGPPLQVIGASPELQVRLEHRKTAPEGHSAIIRPIAGTRPRGKTPAEDLALEEDLLADPKERAEHIMLVDLARNDLGRVCEYGSVRVPEQMVIERYSHVMHIASQVEGRLLPGYDAFDLMRATFPAGTVSGAPKIRAMQIINELEGSPRGIYAGATGYFAYDGSMDTCITIRTLVMRGDTISVQAGAGIVADSDPEREYQETLNKARALAEAIRMAEENNDRGH